MEIENLIFAKQNNIDLRNAALGYSRPRNPANQAALALESKGLPASQKKE